MRGQRVVLDGRYSSWRSITAGMTQGSILGPSFFLINDLSNGLSSSLELFADDTFFIYLQQKNLHKWLKWRLEKNEPQQASMSLNPDPSKQVQEVSDFFSQNERVMAPSTAFL